MKILIIDQNAVVRRQLFVSLRASHQLLEAASRAEGLPLVDQANPDVVLVEPFEQADPDDGAGLALVQRLVAHPSAPSILIITRNDRKDVAVRLLRLGALDVLSKPVDDDELRTLLKRAERLRELGMPLRPQALGQDVVADGDGIAYRNPSPDPSDLHLGIIGTDRRIRQVLEQVRRIAPTPVSVLVTGETGTGKEIFAQAIHKLSDRREQRFVALNCAVLSDSLVEDELFGHEKGAFTGASDRRKGKIEYADRGSFFLDEIGDLGPPLQAKFLRVLQERSFERLGGNQPIAVDFRLISATHRDLPRMAKEGIFREDLMFRINVVSLHIPPLRERRGDIQQLARHFLVQYGRSFGRGDHLTFTREVERFLYDYPWPGNVRELRSFVERAVALSEGSHIGPEVLPAAFTPSSDGATLAESAGTFDTLVKRYKKQLVAEALQTSGYNKLHTADLLGISRSYLFKLIKQLGLPEREPTPVPQGRSRPRSSALAGRQ
ncbi:MAG TPA: sigma-54 dependent transcriptional regulator [bacterium]|nr:sigma-54 dependent transcriptional regulator [bacterium]